MAEAVLQSNEEAGNRKITDPREASGAMSKLVSGTETELGRIHGELSALTQAFQAMTWNDYEFDTDAWLRLMFRVVAQVEELRSDVEHGSFDAHLHKTEAESAEEARKSKVLDAIMKGARAVVCNETGADKVVEAVESAMHGGCCHV